MKDTKQNKTAKRTTKKSDKTSDPYLDFLRGFHARGVAQGRK